MDENDVKKILIDISETTRFVTSETIGALTNASLFGSQIPVGMQRVIWKITASPRSGTAQGLAVFAGMTGTPENTLQWRQRLAATSIEYGGDPLQPLFKVPWVTALNTDDRLAAGHQTDPIDMEISWYDEPMTVPQ